MEKIIENTTNTRLDKILIDLELEYKKYDYEGDIVYIVNININVSANKDMKAMVFLISSPDNKELLIMCPNIYKLRKDDTTLGILVALNKVNSKLSGGAVTLEDGNMVVYRRIAHFARLDSLNKLNVENLFKDVIASIIYTAEEIKYIGKYNE